MTILLGLLFIVFLILMYGVVIYNKLTKLRILCEEGWSAIDVFLKKRYDLIPNLVETVKGYATHEKETLENVTKARNLAANASGVKNQEAAENQLNQAMMNLFAVSEQYPELKANANFMQLSGELTNIEGEIERSRRYYNGTAREYNTTVEMFPSNIIASRFSFTKKEFFEITQLEQKEAPKVSF
ncbi:MAG: LemA family protein [Flavobacterium sp.]